MRRQDHVGQRQQGRILRERLFGEHVQGRARQVSVAQGGGDRGFLHQFAAGAVDQARALFHLADGLGVDQTGALRGERQVQGEVIGGGEHVIQRGKLDFRLARHLGGDEGIVRQHFHAEHARPPRHFHADAPQPDDAQRLAAQLGALQ